MVSPVCAQSSHLGLGLAGLRLVLKFQIEHLTQHSNPEHETSLALIRESVFRRLIIVRVHARQTRSPFPFRHSDNSCETAAPTLLCGRHIPRLRALMRPKLSDRQLYRRLHIPELVLSVFACYGATAPHALPIHTQARMIYGEQKVDGNICSNLPVGR